MWAREFVPSLLEKIGSAASAVVRAPSQCRVRPRAQSGTCARRTMRGERFLKKTGNSPLVMQPALGLGIWDLGLACWVYR